MNSKTRLKTYGILMALILVVVGAVWFYLHTYSSNAPHVDKVVITEQAESNVSKAGSFLSPQGLRQSHSGKYTKFKAAIGGRLPLDKLIIAFQLDDSQCEVLERSLNEVELVARDDIAQISECKFDKDSDTMTVVADLTTDRMDAIRQVFYEAIQQVVGDDAWRMYFNDDLRASCESHYVMLMKCTLVTRIHNISSYFNYGNQIEMENIMIFPNGTEFKSTIVLKNLDPLRPILRDKIINAGRS